MTWGRDFRKLHIIHRKAVVKNVIVVVQLHSCVQFFATPWTVARQASLSSFVSWSLLRLMFIELVMLYKYLILCCPLFFCLQSFPASGSFPMSWLFKSGCQSTGASASALVLPMTIQKGNKREKKIIQHKDYYNLCLARKVELVNKKKMQI